MSLLSNKKRLPSNEIYVLIKAGKSPIGEKNPAFSRKLGILVMGPNHPTKKHHLSKVVFNPPILEDKTWDFNPEDVEVCTWRT